jgi:uncharacterized protein
MSIILYFFSGITFAVGLLLSGMTESQKVKNFLAINSPQWSPALLFVLITASAIYLGFYLLIRRRKKTLNGCELNPPAARNVDQKLIIGSAIFGLGWGISGICPGPAIVHLAFPDLSFLVFIATMIFGFELQRRFS